MRRLTPVIRAVLVALVLLAAFAADKDQRLVREIVFGGLVNVGLWYLLRRRGFFKTSHLDLDSAVLICFAAGATVQALGTHLETEIPRLRAVYRLVFYAYLYFMLSPPAARMSFLSKSILSLLVFTSLPYQWSGIMTAARSLLPALTVLYILWRAYESGRVERSRVLRDASTAAAMLLLLLFAATQVYHHNFFDGIDGFARLLVGAGLFLALRLERRRSAGFTVFSAVALFNLGFLLTAYGFMALDGTHVLIAKRQSLGGINTNDVGTYAVVLIPAAMLGALAAPTRAGRVLASACLLLAFLLIGLSYARIAWLTAVIALVITVLRAKLRFRLTPRAACVPAVILTVLAAAGLPSLVGWASLDLDGEFASLDYRVSLMRQALGLIAGHPLAGVGPGGLGALSTFSQGDPARFASFVELTGGLVHVHNLFLQTWIEAGIIGPAAVAVIAAFAVLRIHSTRARTTGAGALLLIATIVQGQFNHPFEVMQVWLWFCMAAALVLPRVRIPSVRWPAALLFACSVIILAVQILAVDFYASTMESLKGMKFRNILGALEIRSGPMNPDLKSLDALIRLYPGDRRLTQEAAEIYRVSAEQKKEPPLRAISLFQACVQSQVAPAFCLRRLSLIAEASGDRALAEKLEQEASAKDPLRLGQSKVLHPL